MRMRGELGVESRRLVVFLVVLLLVASSAVPATALFTRTHTLGDNTLTTTSVDPPTLDNATADSLLCEITLGWTPPGTGATPDGYDIYRSTSSGGSYDFIDHVGTVTSFTDSGLAGDTTYYYVLQSTRDAWRSVDSNERSATTALLCV